MGYRPKEYDVVLGGESPIPINSVVLGGQEGDIDKFPCQDLHTIDQLWVKLSGRKFGFSIQAEIWDKLEGNSLHMNKKAFKSRHHNKEVEKSQ